MSLCIVTHAIIILSTLGIHLADVTRVAHETKTGFNNGVATLGAAGMMALFLRAYTMGAGTYTGIEAVSNGLQIMREPIVETGKRTMLYMATSLAVTAGGIIFCYLLLRVAPVDGKTMNAVMVEQFVADIGWLSPSLGHVFVLVTLISEAVLLLVAAQAGFVDGPRVMSNMAHDSWLPHRFALLSDRLTVVYGIVVVSLSAILTLLYTHGDISTLVLMYSINVFLTFSLSQAGMIRYWIMHRRQYPEWPRHIVIHLIGFVLCSTIFVISVIEKFTEGGWITVLITSALVFICYAIKSEYDGVARSLKRLDDTLMELPFEPDLSPVPAKDAKAPTAVMVVRKFDGLAIHTLLSLPRLFGERFKNIVFVSVG